MTPEQLKILMSDHRNLITVDDLNDKTPRTLLHGYNMDRDSWDVILEEDGKIKTYKIPYKQPPIEIHVTTNSGFIPDKRVYPASSDFEFCLLLKNRGVTIPFTTF